MKTLLTIIAVVALSGYAEGAPTTTAVVEVDGNAREVHRVLKNTGVRVVEVRGEKYNLPDVKISAVENDGLLVVQAIVDPQPDNLVQTTFKWLITENGKKKADGIEYFPQNQKLIVAAGSKGTSFSFSLDANFLFGLKKTGTVDGKEQEVYTEVLVDSPEFVTLDYTTGGDTPAPDPFPVPPPPPVPDPVVPTPPAPDPVFPPGQYGLSSWIYNIFKSDATLSQAEKLSLATALAANYQAAADSGGADIAGVLKAASTANKTSISLLSLGTKADGVKNQIGQKVYDLNYSSAAVVKTTDDLKDVFREFATGLRGVK